ncbi:cytochrome-c oxidase, cbb3-type subunit III [Pelomonas cellulosilytica]|uniref:Cbb3-type cytochrome c oxidase subunit n=1 Tax=Pelomonas cellulosilytica TaxID=2906762 RepID=A0ABS8XRV9_9BURK|nr:cytochrome-c oxidase, cbb3-type subunit III [Pelomonas sp. P8]MCE4553576.1 cytochrome-c oxidase, cbb3-type subunit III [Pelomonas sp. P8]
MSDFISPGWSTFVAAVTVLGLVACVVLLIIASRRQPSAADNTTGHIWDEDLRELNNPLPLWWMGLFVLTIVFAGAYLALYPGLGSSAGKLGWTSLGEHAAEVAQTRAAMAPVYAAFNGMAPEQLAKDPKAHAIGERLFANNCAQCHGADAKGSKGFPNLTDNDWLWGGSYDTIVETITKGREGNMPVMAPAVGTSEDVRNVANYVLSLSGSPHNELYAQLGKPKFAACAACHGPEGKGTQALGAPNLTDKIWLHGWGEAAVMAMVNNGKHNVMPAHGERLTPEQIKVLAAYVWGLSQSQGVAANP